MFSLNKLNLSWLDHQEKMAMEERKEERKKVPQFGLIKPSTPKRKMTFKVEEMNVRLKKMRIGK